MIKLKLFKLNNMLLIGESVDSWLLNLTIRKMMKKDNPDNENDKEPNLYGVNY